MRGMGFTEAAIAEARKAMVAPEDFELYEDNVMAIEVFDAMSTQWRRAGMDGQAVGLDYAALPAVMGLMGVKRPDRRRTFDDLRILEIEKLRVLAERAK